MTDTKKAINSLVDPDAKQSQLEAAVQRAPIIQKNVTVRSVSNAEVSAGGSTLASPLVMTVLNTKIVNIPVPQGVNSVDVEVVQAYLLTDAKGKVFNVGVVDYP